MFIVTKLPGLSGLFCWVKIALCKPKQPVRKLFSAVQAETGILPVYSPITHMRSFCLFVLMMISCSQQKQVQVPDEDTLHNTRPGKPATDIGGRQDHAIAGSLEEFKDRFNAFAGKADFYTIRKIHVEEGRISNLFSYCFNTYLCLSGSVDKQDHSVRSIIMTARGDGTLSSGADMVVAMCGIIAATNPGLPADERGQILKELGLFDEQTNIGSFSGSTVRNGVKYHITTGALTGIWFGAEIIE